MHLTLLVHFCKNISDYGQITLGGGLGITETMQMNFTFAYSHHMAIRNNRIFR
jgi:hypothetical protein